MSILPSIESLENQSHQETEQVEFKLGIEALSKQFQNQKKIIPAIEHVSLHIKQGEFVSIVGPSGCGKTTLLRIIGGLEEKSSGTLSIIHNDRTKPLKSTVFQEHSIFPWMTVRNNIAYGLKIRKLPKKKIREITD